MALLIKNIELETGIKIESAYIRIDTVSGSKDSVSIGLNYYVNQVAFTSGKPYFKTETYRFKPSISDGSSNFIKQGYEHLKGVSEFIDAQDI